LQNQTKTKANEEKTKPQKNQTKEVPRIKENGSIFQSSTDKKKNLNINQKEKLTI